MSSAVAARRKNDGLFMSGEQWLPVLFLMLATVLFTVLGMNSLNLTVQHCDNLINQSIGMEDNVTFYYNVDCEEQRIAEHGLVWVWYALAVLSGLLVLITLLGVMS